MGGLIARKIDFEVNLGFNWKKIKVLGSNYNFFRVTLVKSELNCINIKVSWPVWDLIEEIWNQEPK